MTGDDIDALGKVLNGLRDDRPSTSWSPTTWSSTTGSRRAPATACSAR